MMIDNEKNINSGISTLVLCETDAGLTMYLDGKYCNPDWADDMHGEPGSVFADMVLGAITGTCFNWQWYGADANSYPNDTDGSYLDGILNEYEGEYGNNVIAYVKTYGESSFVYRLPYEKCGRFGKTALYRGYEQED